MTYHPDERRVEQAPRPHRAGYGDRILELGTIGRHKAAIHIRDDGSATLFDWPADD